MTGCRITFCCLLCLLVFSTVSVGASCHQQYSMRVARILHKASQQLENGAPNQALTLLSEFHENYPAEKHFILFSHLAISTPKVARMPMHWWPMPRRLICVEMMPRCGRIRPGLPGGRKTMNWLNNHCLRHGKLSHRINFCLMCPWHKFTLGKKRKRSIPLKNY